jgi:hypothetical protein
MEDEFYATIKLMSGEEIVAKVCYVEDEDVLIIENPKRVIPVETKRNNVLVKGFTFEEWINASYDEMYIIKREHVLTMTELDKRIKKYYVKFVASEEFDNNPKLKPKDQNGYIASIKEARKNLEDLFKRS